jgi:hypothetical protein
MIVTFPDGKIKNIDEKTLQKGDIVGDWKFEGNTTKPGNPNWNEWVNIKTGESTLKTYIPQIVPSCNEHYYEFIDNNFNYQCRNCFVGGKLSLALNNIKDGKITNLASNKN